MKRLLIALVLSAITFAIFPFSLVCAVLVVFATIATGAFAFGDYIVISVRTGNWRP